MIELEIESRAKFVISDRAECYVHIVLRRWIVFDSFSQPLELPEEPHPRHIGCDCLARAAHEKAKHVLARKSGAAMRARLAPNDAALQRMNVLKGVAAVKVKDHRAHPPTAHPAGNGALDQRLDVRRRIVQVPRPLVDILPFGRAHQWMIRG